MWTKMKILLILILLTGCSTVRGNAELAWQTENFIDMGQTLNTAARPDCYKETNSITALLIGNHPSKGAVVGISVAYSLGHLLISKAIEHKVHKIDSKGWKYIEGFWHAIGLFTKTTTVVDNYNNGLRLFSEKCR